MGSVAQEDMRLKRKDSFFLVTGEKAGYIGTDTGGGWSSAVREWEVV